MMLRSRCEAGVSTHFREMLFEGDKLGACQFDALFHSCIEKPGQDEFVFRRLVHPIAKIIRQRFIFMATFELGINGRGYVTPEDLGRKFGRNPNRPIPRPRLRAAGWFVSWLNGVSRRIRFWLVLFWHVFSVCVGTYFKRSGAHGSGSAAARATAACGSSRRVVSMLASFWTAAAGCCGITFMAFAGSATR
jgi:hypothetical protein